MEAKRQWDDMFIGLTEKCVSQEFYSKDVLKKWEDIMTVSDKQKLAEFSASRLAI